MSSFQRTYGQHHKLNRPPVLAKFFWSLIYVRVIEANESCSTASCLVLDNLPEIFRCRQESAREENWCLFVIDVRVFQDAMGACSDSQVSRQPAHR